MQKLVSNNNYALSTVAGDTVLVPVSDSVNTLCNLFVLNELAAFIFSRIESGRDVADIIADVVAEYDVDQQRADADVNEFVNGLVDKGFFHFE
ncbi:MAG: PqqD family protein [Bacteroidales bacterium]|nr:PqqD family protein [Bacteroidales bacterium]